eukprot:gene17815-24196_t
MADKEETDRANLEKREFLEVSSQGEIGEREKSESGRDIATREIDR